MKKQYRIKKSSEIEQVIKYKRFNKNPLMTVYYKKETAHDNFRYALSVGKKVGKAHVRNSVKRRLRDIISTTCDPTYKVDIFIIVRPNILEVSYDEIKKEFINSLEKLKLTRLVVQK